MTSVTSGPCSTSTPRPSNDRPPSWSAPASPPGSVCLLARHAAAALDQVDEVHVAKVGTGGPACAEQHHRALGADGLDWRDGGWMARSGGSGRELCWFPEPVGGRDCYRAAVPDALLLVDAFGPLERVTARQAANRRDRLTARLPMLRRPHPEGGPGAIRVEVRGSRAGGRDVVVYGAMDRPAVAAGAVAAVTARAVGDGSIDRHGAFGLAAARGPAPAPDRPGRTGHPGRRVRGWRRRLIEASRRNPGGISKKS